MQKTINGQMFKSMVISAAKLLEINKANVDALNVFPVPDGDTGTNMSLTIQSSVRELLNCRNNNLFDICEAVSKGALRGARGNSGVITSQILRGLCGAIKNATEIDVKLFVQGLVAGAEVAYGAVSKPKEGTILTVISSFNPMDCSLPGSSVHGISQARILEWVAISFSRGSSQPRI